ncbi:MAG: ABC transporter [Flavobacteriaceae bacterium]|uniref:ABC transporter permease n=1 Tax=Leeuwenhoekiella sp. UBA1003 TaxID=1946744 RepID=UPI000C904A12|nr:ABC transporter permease [Leeuwenhoekiella sp. UBA1003]MAT90047.1 ABC transporter [Flavobacteriaceae bacterium]|tara:strand:- start:803 stop:2083 length:1281 start_codon:yes stop_codon:yes gene_type:complete
MHKLWAAARKEAQLLRRDLGGLAILFVMPIVLVVTITLIQDSSFKSISQLEIPILWVDLDQGPIAAQVLTGLKASEAFVISEDSNEDIAAQLVRQGDYKLALVIPEGLSEELKEKVTGKVDATLATFGIAETVDSIPESEATSTQEIKLYFDPVTQQTFKNSVKNGIDKLIAQVESEMIYQAFETALNEGETSSTSFAEEPFIAYKEITMGHSEASDDHTLNSAQHNVPAWALFAIFFIIVPLSVNMVKEKGQGTFARLQAAPVSYLTLLGGKTIVYISVCLLQFLLMLLIGRFLFPVIGLPQLDIANRWFLLFFVALCAGFAAIGLGLLLGTLANTQEQAAPFGATFVVILAALGGVWVPVFVMPPFMQALSKLSPMNWGLNAFYEVFLRQGAWQQLLPDIGLLLGFFIITTGIAVVYHRKQHRI